MGLFNLFKKSGQTQELYSKTKNIPIDVKEEIIKDNLASQDPEITTYSVEYGSKLPIDIIYGFLKEDYENKAYRDAITSPDRSYKQTNLLLSAVIWK